MIMPTSSVSGHGAPLDARSVLRRIDQRIVTLRRALGHDHRDHGYWNALGLTASAAQAERALLRWYANLLHVERATVHHRIHGTRFADLDAQRAWLAGMEHHRWTRVAHHHAGLPDDTTLARLRAGELSS
jgi:hypothetical protein